VILSSGCRKEELPRLLFGSLERRNGRAVALLVLDARLRSPSARLISFEPAPRGAYSVVQGSGARLEVVFEDPDPFPAALKVHAVLRGGIGGSCALSGGISHPVLSAATWRDENANRVVDQGDTLVLRFSSPVAVKEDGVDPRLEFFLPEGTDQLGEGNGGAAPALSQGTEDPRTADLRLGEEAYLRPTRGGEPPASFLGFNATYAAPSRLITSRDAGLGAVARTEDPRAGWIPIRSQDGFEPFDRVGTAFLGPQGGNESSTVTICQGARRCLVVIAGGADREARGQAKPDIFAYALTQPGTLLAELKLSQPRYGHVAVALPVPTSSRLWAAVLVMGGMQGVGKYAEDPELVCIQGPEQSQVVRVSPEELGLPSFLEPRVDAQAVYVSGGERTGFVVITGGEVVGAWSVDVLQVTWPANGASAGGARRIHRPAVTFYDRNELVGDTLGVGRISSRTGHTLTPVEVPGRGRGVLLFGGKERGGSCALPFLVIPESPERAGEAEVLSLSTGRTEDYARHGHGAVYLPGKGRVVVLGGRYERLALEQDIPLDEALEIDPDPASKRIARFPGQYHEYRIDPGLVHVPGTEKILVVGGRDQTGRPFRTVDLYLHPLDSLSLPRLQAFGALLPEGLDEVQAAFLAYDEPEGTGRIYLLGGNGTSVWAFDVP
jgi:hypothetical protein